MIKLTLSLFLISCINIAGKSRMMNAELWRNMLLSLQFRVNTFGNKVKVVPGLYHAVHEYNDTLKNIYLDDFQASEEFQSFCNRSGRKSICFNTFKRGALRCDCIKKPTMRVCVDENETEFTELTTTLQIITQQM